LQTVAAVRTSLSDATLLDFQFGQHRPLQSWCRQSRTHFSHLIGGLWLAEQISLSLGAVSRGQARKLINCLHPFSRRCHAESFPKIRDNFDNAVAVTTLPQAGNEGLVDFDFAER
jgi:hypothetical protein